MTSPIKNNVTFLSERIGQQQNSVSSPSNMLNGQLPDYCDNHDVTQVNRGYDNYKEYTDMDILEKYIDKMDRDQSDLRNDIRASEERTERRIERLEQLILSQNQNMENRFDSLEQKFEQKEVNIENKILRLESKLDQTKTDMENKFDSLNKWVMGTSIATLVGIAAMVIAVIIGGMQLIPALVQALSVLP